VHSSRLFIEDAKRIQLLGIHEFEYLDELTKYANKCLIPNGQDMNELPGYQSVDGVKGVPVFGFCGRLATYHKGLDLMLKGFHKYLENGGEGQLELIGDGSDRPALTALAEELKIENNVIFHGKKFGKEKFDLLHGMDVFLHTSRMEGFPTAVLEAAALKKPCITSEATNMNRYIEKYDAGFILEKNTPEEIAEKMQTAANGHQEKSLLQLGENAHRMVTEVFDWEIIAEQLVKEYTA